MAPDPSDRRPGAVRAELDLSLLYGGLFLGLGAQMAFHQIWLQDLGLDDAAIGWVNVFAILVRIVAGAALPALADRFGRPGAAMAGLALLGAATALLHLGVGADWRLIALTALLAAVYAGLIPLSDAHGYASAEEGGFSYRRARSVGSFAFLAATFGVGWLVAGFGSDVVMIWIAASLLLAALGARRASRQFPAATDAAPAREALFAGAALLLRDRRFALFLACVAAVNASHAVYYVYGSVHWRALGYSEGLIGALWAWGVLAEIGLFWVGLSVMTRVSAEAALGAAGAAAVLRWSWMAFDPALAVVVLLQTLHALTFALMHLAAMRFIRDAAPRGRAGVAQGLMSATSGGAAMALAASLASLLYPVAAGASYALGAVSGALGVFLAWRLHAGRAAREGARLT